jgi:hypothetical protein
MKDFQFSILEHWYLIKIGNITKSMWFLINNARKIKFFKRLKLNHTQCYYGVFLLQDALKFATTLERVLYEHMKTVRALSTMDASAPTNKRLVVAGGGPGRSRRLAPTWPSAGQLDCRDEKNRKRLICYNS